MPKISKVQAAIRALDLPLVVYPGDPEGRLAIFIYAAAEGFVWVEPGYQDPLDASPRAHYWAAPITLVDGKLEFDGGEIREAPGELMDCMPHWWRYVEASGRNWQQERAHVLETLLGGHWGDIQLE